MHGRQALPCSSHALRAAVGDPRMPEAVRGRVEAMRAGLDPVGLPAEMRAAQRALVASADQGVEAPTTVDAPWIEAFLASFDGLKGGRGPADGAAQTEAEAWPAPSRTRSSR